MKIPPAEPMKTEEMRTAPTGWHPRAEEWMCKRHLGDLYVFDLAVDCRMVSWRAPEGKRVKEECFSAWLEPREREALPGYLTGYGENAILLRTRYGAAMLLPMPAPAASLFAVFVPSLPERKWLPLAASGRYGDFRVDGSCAAEAGKRGCRVTEEEEEDFGTFCDELFACFEGLVSPKRVEPGSRIDDRLCGRLWALSSFVGCPVRLIRCDVIRDFGEFDFSLYTAFLLVCLCMVRRYADDRTAEVALEAHRYGGAVALRFSASGLRSANDVREIATLESIAERKNMLFERSAAGGTVSLRFSPMNKDWSYLGLKAPELDGWD